jgi:hypothetical protein
MVSLPSDLIVLMKAVKIGRPVLTISVTLTMNGTKARTESHAGLAKASMRKRRCEKVDQAA